VTGLLRDAGRWPVVPGAIVVQKFVVEDAADRLLATISVAPLADPRPLPNTRPLAAIPTVVIGSDDGDPLPNILATDIDLVSPASVQQCQAPKNCA
jgi:hypothetical protein